MNYVALRDNKAGEEFICAYNSFIGGSFPNSK